VKKGKPSRLQWNTEPQRPGDDSGDWSRTQEERDAIIIEYQRHFPQVARFEGTDGSEVLTHDP
jgi:hypothetical protein